MDAPEPRPFLARHEFLIRRLHSLCGLIPVGAYMVIHLVTNASVLNGPATFQDNVDKIHSLGNALPLVEWMFIFIPIIFHAVIGVVMIRGGMPNTQSYPYIGNFRYTAQRATGMIAFAFILYHMIHMHGWWGAPFKSVGGAQFDPHHATSSAAGAIQAAPLIMFVYAIGILACVYHLANGLWTMGITWGVWTTPAAQQRANYISIVFGVGLAIVALSALGGMYTADPARAKAMEDFRIEQHEKEAEAIKEALGHSGDEAAELPASGDAAAVENKTRPR